MSPTTNPFFNHTYPGTSTEQNLIDDLVIEQIGMFGLDVLYMPRRHMNLDKLLHESTKSAFELALPIPMYLKTFSGYNNGIEMLTKFGVRSSDEMTLVLSRSQFIANYSPYLKSYYNAIDGRPSTEELDYLSGQTAARPKEGDLVYNPFDDSIFEIKYVLFDEPFFQLGRGYVFELQCEKFEYSGETFETGYYQVDDLGFRPDYYRMEFSVETGGLETFQQQERVTIYDMSGLYLKDQGLYKLAVDSTDENKDGVYLAVDYTDPETNTFDLYQDPGFLHEVTKVEGTVYDWDKPDGRLLVGDLSDLDPDQQNKETLDVTENKFDHVMIVGQTSGAVWYSMNAQEAEAAGNDSKVIQEEFDEIKIIDDADTNPFGFV